MMVELLPQSLEDKLWNYVRVNKDLQEDYSIPGTHVEYVEWFLGLGEKEIYFWEKVLEEVECPLKAMSTSEYYKGEF